MRTFRGLVTAGLALAVLAVPAYADAAEVTIAWPDLVEVAVPTTPYTFTVDDTAAAPQGTLYAEWQGERQQIPHQGTHSMTFTMGGEGVITVIRCVEGDCRDTGIASPEVTVWKESPMTLGEVSGIVTPGERTAQVDLPDAPDTELELTWELSYGDTSYGHGLVTITTDDAGHATFPYTVPTGRSGRLGLTAKTAYDQPPFGPHRATAAAAYFDVDHAAPRLSLSLGTTSVYPVADGYRDQLTIRYGTSEQVTQRVQIRSSSGAVIRSLATGTLGSGHTGATRTITWNGRDSADRVVPAGSYTVHVQGTDRVGRTATVTRSVTVSHKKLVQKTWRRTFRAGSLIAGAKVGACSSLRRPARSDWPGSLGLHSQTKCHRWPASAVRVTHRASVPKAFGGRYGRLQVWLYGGGARGVPGGGRDAYLAMGYLNSAMQPAQLVQFNGVIARHTGRAVYGPKFIRDKASKPYLLWMAGLSGGSKYDVRSYTVKLTYFVLQ